MFAVQYHFRLFAFALVFLCAVGAQAFAANWGLTLFVMVEQPLPDLSGHVSYSPGSRAVTRLIFENRGEAPLEKIRVDVDLVGATPVAEAADAWKRDGNSIRATIPNLAPGESVELPLVVELADGTERGARGTGGEARIRATVPASGETLVAEANWPIASCADAFHAALREIRYNEFAALRVAVDASREADQSLPGGTAFTFKSDANRSEASAIRFAEQIARARGLDDYYDTKDIRWVSGRLINDIGTYLGQDRYPGLCTGVDQWTGVLGDYIGRFTTRAQEVTRYRSDLAPAVQALVAAAGEGSAGQSSGDFEAWTAAAALLSTIGGGSSPQGVAIFASADEAIGAAGDTLAPDRRQALAAAFGALERLWYLEFAEARAQAVADGFSGTLGAIRDAHEATCTCGS